MAPKPKVNKGKAVATSVADAAQREWTPADTAFAHLLSQCKLRSTRMTDDQALIDLGLKDDYYALMDHMGLGQLPRMQPHLSTRLAKEFLATVTMHFPDPADPDVTEGSISFFIDQVLYTMSLDDLCDVFGFEKNPFCEMFEHGDAREFWHLIGSGRYESRRAKQSLIRNPVIRIAARFLSLTLGYKAEAAALDRQELWLLQRGLLRFTDGLPRSHRVNMGYILASALCAIKTGPAASSKKVVVIGSLVTPILEHVGIEVPRPTSLERCLRMTREYLGNCGILVPNFPVYHFQDRTGMHHYMRLPQMGYTALVSRDNVEFLPPASALCPRPSQHAPPAPVDLEAAPEEFFPVGYDPDSQRDPGRASTSRHRTSTSPLLPPDFSTYVVSDYPHEPQSDFERWMVDSTKKNNTMLQRIWGALSRIRPCCTAPSTTDDETGDHVPAAASDAIGAMGSDAGTEVLGYSDEDTATLGDDVGTEEYRAEDTESPDATRRLSRSRRDPGCDTSSSGSIPF